MSFFQFAISPRHHISSLLNSLENICCLPFAIDSFILIFFLRLGFSKLLQYFKKRRCSVKGTRRSSSGDTRPVFVVGLGKDIISKLANEKFCFLTTELRNGRFFFLQLIQYRRQTRLGIAAGRSERNAC